MRITSAIILKNGKCAHFQIMTSRATRHRKRQLSEPEYQRFKQSFEVYIDGQKFLKHTIRDELNGIRSEDMRDNRKCEIFLNVDGYAKTSYIAELIRRNDCTEVVMNGKCAWERHMDSIKEDFIAKLDTITQEGTVIVVFMDSPCWFSRFEILSRRKPNKLWWRQTRVSPEYALNARKQALLQ